MIYHGSLEARHNSRGRRTICRAAMHTVLIVNLRPHISNRSSRLGPSRSMTKMLCKPSWPKWYICGMPTGHGRSQVKALVIRPTKVKRRTTPSEYTIRPALVAKLGGFCLSGFLIESKRCYVKWRNGLRSNDEALRTNLMATLWELRRLTPATKRVRWSSGVEVKGGAHPRR